jgi:hypothetical protein
MSQGERKPAVGELVFWLYAEGVWEVRRVTLVERLWNGDLRIYTRPLDEEIELGVRWLCAGTAGQTRGGLMRGQQNGQA